ncbi:MAG: ABC transporter permease subunit [Chitinivibrionales bacterium]|nr:ABC transporter permease subunit [Chitinivibrionales bacterium]
MNKRAADIAFYSVLVLFLGVFLLYPIAGVFSKTFFFGGSPSLSLFWRTVTGPTVAGALARSIGLACAAVILTTVISLPLAVFVSTYEFRLKKLAAGLVLIPMIMPPFVGAIGIKRLLARYGTVNMLFGLEPFDWFEFSGFWGVAFLQALHLFPIMYLNVSAALANIDPQLGEASRSSGAGPWRAFRDVTFPLALPGFLSGAVIIFLWSLTDLGTPLVLGYRRLLAVEIFDRVAAINNDPTGAAMVVFVVLITLLFIYVFKRFFSDTTIGSGSKGYRAAESRTPSPALSVVMHAYIALLLVLALLPHFGLMLTSVAEDWFLTAFPSDVTLRFFGDALGSEGVSAAVRNSLLYSSVSTLLDVVLGVVIAYYVLRRRIGGAWLVDAVVMLPIALPGLILAFGYVATFSGTFLDPLKNPVPLLVIGYAVRRLPYCFRAAYAGLQQVGVEYEEAARVSGARPVRAVLTITVPLIAANVIAGGILSFMFAVLEVSESMILAVKKEFFPLTREIYALLGKIPDGDYIASALGVLCMLFLAAGLIAASVLMGKHLGRMFRV